MCTLALYFRCFEAYPLLLAANRDEHFDRPSAAPALWDGKPKIIAGKDLRAGGTWLGVNEFGLLAAMLNRRIDGTPLPPTLARSRGLLCKELLEKKTLAAALDVVEQDRARYNPFTAVFADKDSAYVAYNDDAKIHVAELKPALHVFSSAAEFELHSAKAERAYKGFAGLLEPKDHNSAQPVDWLPRLKTILSDHSLGNGSDNPGDAICVHRQASGTVSSTVIFLLPLQRRFTSFHCSSAPCLNDFGPAVDLTLR